MTENQAEEYARRVFEAHEFRVDRLEAPDGGRCADFLVTKESDSFLLEVTDKRESDFLSNLLLKAKDGGIATASRKSSFSNRIDGILRDKEEQLVQTSRMYPNIPRVVWLSALNRDSEYILRCVKNTAYGLQTVSVLSASGEFISKRCFYRTHSAFFRFQNIDAVILAGIEGGTFCLNEFSKRAATVRDSNLAQMFPPEGRIDPIRLERSGKAYCVRGDINRRDDKAVWQYLYDTYGVRTALMHSSEFVGYAHILSRDE
ncbi:MAG: hypothetical protein HC883_03700 [Bdellovibrionaceae bacterium]|nr:hypothetical protein [Pseudobdellovibrionaceae bacterium]